MNVTPADISRRHRHRHRIIVTILTVAALTCVFPKARGSASAFLLRQRGRRYLHSMMSFSSLSFVDIGANLLDERFTEGVYNGKSRHDPDWNEMLRRAQDAGVKYIILTAGTLQESKKAVNLVRELRQVNGTIRFGCTVGVHPTRCRQEFVEGNLPPEQVLAQLKALALDGQSDQSVVALGEIGLDYDRLEFCDQETQLDFLEKQLNAMASPELDSLPLFLHNRNVGRDLLQTLKQDPRRKCGVVHSFDDSLELAQEFMDLGLYIGINGCSLKTAANLEVVKALPLDKILLETDCPYCKWNQNRETDKNNISFSLKRPACLLGEIKPTHAGSDFVKTKWDKKADKKFELGKMVKGRNEPCQIIQVAEVVAHVKGLPLKEIADACYRNSLNLYGWKES